MPLRLRSETPESTCLGSRSLDAIEFELSVRRRGCKHLNRGERHEDDVVSRGHRPRGDPSPASIRGPQREAGATAHCQRAPTSRACNVCTMRTCATFKPLPCCHGGATSTWAKMACPVSVETYSSRRNPYPPGCPGAPTMSTPRSARCRGGGTARVTWRLSTVPPRRHAGLASRC